MSFRQITRSDFPKIKHILETIVQSEEALNLYGDASEKEWEDYLFGDASYEVWALEEEGKILGAYHQRPNQKGLGSHIANGGYIVDPAARGRGVGRRLGEHSIARAKEQGYHGIQFNFVISTNEIAVKLWKSLGFEIIGTVPGGYHCKQQEYMDAYIMFRSLLGE
jgi:L-amino acid N-acyltransferase YncA